jgi:Clp amino terminal domain, pathogenicity island component
MMTELDTAGLVVIAGQVLGIGTDAALSQLDIPAAEAALTEARLAGQQAASAAARSRRPGSAPAPPHRAAAGAAAVTLMHALLRHPPLPGHGEQVAAGAGLQFLAVNGWQADLDVPRAAAIVIQGLASGQLTPADAASWLEARLSPDPAAPDRATTTPTPRSPGSRARRIMLAPFAAVRRRPGPRPGPFAISLGSPDKPAGIRTPATGLMPFTGPALSSVILSGQEARRHGQPRGLEHILLGLAGQDDSVAVKALERLGISAEAIRRQAENIAGPSQPQAQSGQGPDTPQARRVWHAVLDEAVAHGDSYIGTEHFLLGLLCRRDAPVVQALASLGAEEDEVRAAITAQRAESGPERPARQHGAPAR